MKPILMDHTKTLSQLVADTSNGLGVLNDVTSCGVAEERNGAYTLSMKISIKDSHFSDITVGGVVKVEVNEEKDTQLFRIRRISKPLNGIVSIEANHISYDLNKTSVPPFSTNGITNVLSKFESTMIGGPGFNFFTDIVNSTSAFRNPKPQSCRALLGGQQGSVLDVFGGEYEFDNATVKLLANRGADHGVRLSYGKNITDIKQDENIDSMYTAVMPYAVVNDNVIVGDLQTIVQVAEPKVLNLDLSSKFDDTNPPTTAKLNTAAQAYIGANDLTAPKVSIDVSFVALWQTEEYKHIALLERVHLCDTVHVYFEKLGIEATAKVVKTEWDVLKGRYKKIEIGDAKSTLAKTLSSITDGVDDAISSATGYLDERIGQFTDLIAQGLGLFVTKEPVGETGGVRIYLHNKPQRVDSQYQWTINANGLAVSQDYGQTWTAGIDSSGNAVVNSLSANIIRALQIYGSVIRFGNTAYVTAQTNASQNGVIFEGDGTVDFKTRGAYDVQNMYSSSVKSNQIRLSSNYGGSSEDNHAVFSNYLNGYLRNAVELGAGANTNPFTEIRNYEVISGSSKLANSLKMDVSSTSTQFLLQNAKGGSTKNSVLLYTGTENHISTPMIDYTLSGEHAETYIQNSYGTNLGCGFDMYASSGRALMSLGHYYGAVDKKRGDLFMSSDGYSHETRLNSYYPQPTANAVLCQTVCEYTSDTGKYVWLSNVRNGALPRNYLQSGAYHYQEIVLEDTNANGKRILLRQMHTNSQIKRTFLELKDNSFALLCKNSNFEEVGIDATFNGTYGSSKLFLTIGATRKELQFTTVNGVNVVGYKS